MFDRRIGKMNGRSILKISTFICVLLAPVPAFAQDLMALSLEDLLSMPVTSLSGREQKKSEVASAMTVITKEDIQRSGAHNIPDLFYRVPGMQVRKIDGHRYYVSIRKYGSLKQGSLLVLIDNVVVFNPLENGTNWDLLPITLDEIERIEIIRGPGGVLYSSNAVSGVINIISKAATVNDNYAAMRAGSMDFLQDRFGVGQKINDQWAVRGYFQQSKDSGLDYLMNGLKRDNSSESNIAGLKTQYDWSEDTNLVVDGKFYNGIAHNDGSNPVSRANFIKRPGYEGAFYSRFQQKVNELYDYNVHVDHTRISTTNITSNDTDTSAYTFKSQHNLTYNAWGEHVTSAGMEARWIKIYDPIYMQPPASPSQTQQIKSVFLQDEYRPTDRLILSAGVRVTDNTVVVPKAGLLYEPRASAIYKLDENNNLRAIVSKTVRTPSMFDQDALITLIPGSLYIRGPLDLDPEKVWTYELGWQRLMLDKKFNMDTSVFYTVMRDAIFPGTVSYSSGGATYRQILNNGSVKTIGLEWSGEYAITKALSAKADYTVVSADKCPDFDEAAGYARAQSLNLSRHQIGTGLSYTKNDLMLDAYIKWISGYMDAGEATGKYPSYWKTMLRAAYKFRMPGMKMDEKDAEFELVANDIVHANVAESPHQYIRQPDIYAGIKIKF